MCEEEEEGMENFLVGKTGRFFLGQKEDTQDPVSNFSSASEKRDPQLPAPRHKRKRAKAHKGKLKK